MPLKLSARSTITFVTQTLALKAILKYLRLLTLTVFGMNGYSEDEMNEYIPALVYTMYDGFYIYSRFNNQNYLYEVDENGNVTNNPLDKNGENVFGLKPYISYSVKYNPNSDLDIVITYSLDNYISIKIIMMQ